MKIRGVNRAIFFSFLLILLGNFSFSQDNKKIQIISEQTAEILISNNQSNSIFKEIECVILSNENKLSNEAILEVLINQKMILQPFFEGKNLKLYFSFASKNSEFIQFENLLKKNGVLIEKTAINLVQSIQ
jgi:hypothetical protein